MSTSSTITLEAAAEREWQAVVVGAGPAGTMAAREFARRGVRTLLVDKANFPRGKVCGCCLNGAALAALEAVGLGELPVRLGGVPLTNVRLSAGGRSATIRLPSGVAVSREAFDAALIQEAINAGADFLADTSVKRAPATYIQESLQLQWRSNGNERVIASQVLVVAAGLNGRLDSTPESASQTAESSRIGAGVVLEIKHPPVERGAIGMAVGRGGYVGMVRLEDGRLDVAAAFDPEFVKRSGGLGGAAYAVLQESGVSAIDGLEDAPWRGTPALTRSAKQVAGHRWFAVGDAAGYVEPFTGEGMAWAMTSGAAVVPLATKALRCWEDSLVDDWQRMHARLIRSRQGTCRLAAAVLRSPMLSRFAVGVLSMVPFLSRPVVASLNRPSPLRREAVA